MPRSKYGNRKVTVDGHKFDSQREANRYLELKLLEHNCDIDKLELQIKLPIVINGLKVCDYVADFRYIDTATGETITEDSKGYKTDIYRLKKKLVKAVHGIEILET